MRRRSWVTCLVLALACPGVAFAQETGSISGTVVDPSGLVVVGATVRVAGKPQPTPRSTVTSAEGTYAFRLLPPGDYKMEFEKAGVGKATRDVTVALDRDTQVDVILGSQVSENLSVLGAITPIDLKSAEVSANFTRAFIQALPLERSYLGLLQLVPGVADSGGVSPNGGGSRFDNSFLIDGVNITGNLTNPLFGYLASDVNELDITELTIKRAAVSAEFGRTAGMLSNALTRSGTNTISGTYRFEGIPDQLIENSTKTLQHPPDRWANSFGIGGPIKKDQFFFYGSARVVRSSVTDAINNFGPVPDRRERTEEYFGKLTGLAGAKQTLSLSYRYQPSRLGNAGIGVNDAPTVGTNQKEINRIINATYDRLVNSRTTLSVRLVRVSETSEATALTDLGTKPAFDDHALSSMGRYVIAGLATGGASLRLNRADFTWNEFKTTMSRSFATGRMTHYAKAGVGVEVSEERLTRESNGWGDVSHVIQGSTEYILTSYLPAQPKQVNTAHTYSWFLQDSIAAGSRLTLNTGLLFDKDTFAQTAPVARPFLSFSFADEIQPRIGANFQLRRNRKEKVYVHWGRYSALDQRSSGRVLATGRFEIDDTLFTLDEGDLISTTPEANTLPKTAATGLKAPTMNEGVVGYAARLFGIWTLDAYVMMRKSTNFIEDGPENFPSFSSYVDAPTFSSQNVPLFSGYEYRNDPAAERSFKTFTFALTRPVRNRWALSASYAWSRFSGTYDLDYSAALGGSAVVTNPSLINDGPGAFTVDTNRKGLLSQDHTHVYKVLATWLPPWKWAEGGSVGMYVRGQSGTPWEARGLPWNSTTTYLRYLEPAGTHRNPFWTNVDLLAKYGRHRVFVEARLLNAFNQETVLAVDQRKFLDPLNRTLTHGFQVIPACTHDHTNCPRFVSDAMVQGTSQPNPRYGTPIAYAPQRRLLLSLIFEF